MASKTAKGVIFSLVGVCGWFVVEKYYHKDGYALQT
jgi:hypothetical protein